MFRLESKEICGAFGSKHKNVSKFRVLDLECLVSNLRNHCYVRFQTLGNNEKITYGSDVS